MQRYSKLPQLPHYTNCNTPISRRNSHTGIHNINRRLGGETIAQLIADYQAGQSSTVLMRKYDLGKGTVLRILDQAGVTRTQRTMANGQLKEAAELYQQGWSLAQLGEYFGFGQSTIWAGLKRMGVDLRRPWERMMRPKP